MILSADAATPRILLSIRSDLFGWELPGGTVEDGETAEAALVREVREETGFDVEIDRHVGDWVRTGFRPHTAHIFRCRVVSGKLTPSDETPRVAWFEADAPPSALFPWYRAPLAAALANQEATTEHERQGTESILEAMRIDLDLRWNGLPEPEREPES